MSALLQTAIDRLNSGEMPNATAVEASILAMLDGEATDQQIGDWLLALKAQGEDAAALVGGARALLGRATRMPALRRAVDTCGTGGDGSGSLNVSTLAAFALAASGVPVAKHGNRSVSSKTGSADLIAALGVDLEASESAIAHAFAEVGLAFLFAPRFHPALRRVATVRKSLGTRTLFNLLGPLCNPADAAYRVVGVFDKRWLVPMARALSELSVERAVVLCGAGNLDEPSPSGFTEVAWVEGERVTTATLSPADFGLTPASLDDLRGGEVADNLTAGMALLRGERTRLGAYNAIVMSAALGLHLYERVPLRDAARRIGATLASGEAHTLITRWRTALGEGAA